MPASVLFLSARMGAGHEGAANELARRVRDAGHRAAVVDFLDAVPAPVAWAWQSAYRAQVRWRPESYERSYQLNYEVSRGHLWDRLLGAEDVLASRRLLGWIREHEADAVVSTYSFATLLLGRLRAKGKLDDVALVNYLTDFGVHPHCVSHDTDLNLALHGVTAGIARTYTDVPVVVGGGAVRPTFGALLPVRAAARAGLGLPTDRPIVLVVAGSWGVGEVELTVRALCRSGAFTVVTACGTETRLRRRLQRDGLGVAVGWTDKMPELVAAADVVVENAGGLTSLEAMASGTPVVSYRVIPGHGRDNVANMVRAGVTIAPADDAELVSAVADLAADGPHRDAQVSAGLALFAGDPAAHVLELIGSRVPSSR